MRRTTVVGSGVIGLSIAHELAAAGDAVTVVADADIAHSVSTVAAAVWFPYLSASPQTGRWLERSLARFRDIALDPSAGVDLRLGTVVERTTDPDRSWMAVVDDARPATAADLPAGALSAVRATVPVVTTGAYGQWLTARCRALGVGFEVRHVESVDALAEGADLVVVAGGLRSGALLGDDESVVPVRGQVVRLENPGLTQWWIDDDNPAGLTYVVPRRDDIVCGGVSEFGATGLEPDPETERAILERTAALVPQLAGLRIVSRGVGLRPSRPVVRLERVAGHAVPVVACYGHGGSGVTLSWGCAEDVAALAAGL
ncbi:MAG: ABC transporter substrate-binding protein [Micrococcales bacterium 70-64]|nr:FAD-binding oxidoreductase [Leifsonia sp.]ODU64923.1 MAG: ABC transporter substrate-binding protein [Leifsonia sp. SCN 70-46]OJX86615.1 MAG: ABC transporter substrate-binding protein [Micrococcales bacterium 70-64]